MLRCHFVFCACMFRRRSLQRVKCPNAICSIPAEARVGPIGVQTPTATLVYSTSPPNFHLQTTPGIFGIRSRLGQSGGTQGPPGMPGDPGIYRLPPGLGIDPVKERPQLVFGTDSQPCLQYSQKGFRFCFLGGAVGSEIVDFGPLPGPARPWGG